MRYLLATNTVCCKARSFGMYLVRLVSASDKFEHTVVGTGMARIDFLFGQNCEIRSSPRATSILGRCKNARKRNPDPRLSRDDSTGGRWWSLQRPRHRPNGTGLSLAITTTSLVAAPSTRAPDHLAAQHVRVMLTSARVWQFSAGCCGKIQATALNSGTHDMVVCAAISFRGVAMARSSRGAPPIH